MQLHFVTRVMKESKSSIKRSYSLATLVVSLVLAEGVSMYMDSNFLGLIFFIVMFGEFYWTPMDVMNGTQ